MKLKQIILPAVLTTLLTASAGWAQDNQAQNPEQRPFTFNKLPPGQLKRNIGRLAPQAKDAAMKWLNGFTFPRADFDNLRVDDTGAIFYADDVGNIDWITDDFELITTSEISLTEAFSLHSKPNASSVIYIDFDGHVIENTAWNGSRSPAQYIARPFNSEGDENSFSSTELNQIAETWHRMAEDFAIFDVDVTTEEPASFGPNTVRVLITPNTDANGTPMPASDAGGVAYVDVFGRSNFQFYSPALVYSNNLSNRVRLIAEAASHEAGHNLGLSHDGTSTLNYYRGHGSGATSWGPIMGVGYNRNVTQWSKGEYADANNPQDDIDIMLGKMGRRTDDHANSVDGATALSIGVDGSISATTPETDFNNNVTENKGIVNSANDVDFFSFNSGQGTIDITVTPSWAAWAYSSSRGNNLDVSLSLYDGAGNLLSESDPTDETNARIFESVSPGTYYIRIRGVGNQFSPYSDYGSQGQYFINGVIPVGDPDAEPDTTAPTPNPMTFASVPTGISDSSISMTASTATDESAGVVEYYFFSQAAGNSGWTFNTTYTATGLTADTEYSWQVKARDTSGNETLYSLALSARTKPEQPTLERPPAVTDLTVINNDNRSATLNWSDVASETSYEVYRETFQSGRNRWRSNTLVASLPANSTSYTDVTSTGIYRYYIRSINSVGVSNSAWVSVTITTACKGGSKKCGVRSLNL